MSDLNYDDVKYGPELELLRERQIQRHMLQRQGKIDLVDMTEIARMTGVARRTLIMWRIRGKLPPAYSELAIGPVWARDTIEEWWADRQAK